MTTRLLEKPVYVGSVDYNKYPIKIISDTNYKMIFEMPLRIFKAANSYLTLDKFRIADNFINPTDYCIIFGDTNERYNIRSNETKLLGKIYEKYDLHNINVLVRGFNIPNQTGEYFTTLIIYYTFNGEQYTITKNVRYVIELPNVLDNEYLIATVTRLDNTNKPTEHVGYDGNGQPIFDTIGNVPNMETKELLTNV